MKWFKILIIFITATILMAGCKNYEEEIIGIWTFQTFDNQPQGTLMWTFKDDGTVIRLLTYDAISSFPGGISIDTANYVIDKSLFKTQIEITNSEPLWAPSGGYDDINGVYNIEKFKEDLLVITRTRLADDETAGAYLRCELIRKQ